MSPMPSRKSSNHRTETVQQLPQSYNLMEPLKVTPFFEFSFTTKEGISKHPKIMI